MIEPRKIVLENEKCRDVISALWMNDMIGRN